MSDWNDKKMIFTGKRLAPRHEAMLKTLAYGKMWSTQLGAGYKMVVHNSLGEVYADEESWERTRHILTQKDISFARQCIEKLKASKEKLLAEAIKTPDGDYTDQFAEMVGLFFVAKNIFERIYAAADLDVKKEIEDWRNDTTLFAPLDLYYKNHPQDAIYEDKPWSWMYRDGVLSFSDTNIAFSRGLSEEKPQNADRVHGRCAYPGTVRAKARVMTSTTDKSLLKQGEILIAAMTTIEFMPIMQKASAFITDEGGITSHAAIMARELKKPCLIGTKNATSIFQTGDLIELDAGDGVARVVDRHAKE